MVGDKVPTTVTPLGVTTEDVPDVTDEVWHTQPVVTMPPIRPPTAVVSTPPSSSPTPLPEAVVCEDAAGTPQCELWEAQAFCDPGSLYYVYMMINRMKSGRRPREHR